MPIRNVLLGTEAARKAYAATDRPSSPWYFTAVNIVAHAEERGQDPWVAAREILLKMNHEIATLTAREVQRRLREPPPTRGGAR